MTDSLIEKLHELKLQMPCGLARQAAINDCIAIVKEFMGGAGKEAQSPFPLPSDDHAITKELENQLKQAIIMPLPKNKEHLAEAILFNVKGILRCHAKQQTGDLSMLEDVLRKHGISEEFMSLYKQTAASSMQAQLSASEMQEQQAGDVPTPFKKIEWEELAQKYPSIAKAEIEKMESAIAIMKKSMGIPSEISVIDDYRKEFEFWAKSKKLPINISDHFITAGAYAHQDTHVAWLGWKARGAVKPVSVSLEKCALAYCQADEGFDMNTYLEKRPHPRGIEMAKAVLDSAKQQGVESMSKIDEIALRHVNDARAQHEVGALPSIMDATKTELLWGLRRSVKAAKSVPVSVSLDKIHAEASSMGRFVLTRNHVKAVLDAAGVKYAD